MGLRALDIGRHLISKYPNKKISTNDIVDNKYAITEVIVDDKFSFQQITEGLGWEDQRVYTASEALVQKHDLIFEKLSKAIKTEDNREVTFIESAEVKSTKAI